MAAPTGGISAAAAATAAASPHKVAVVTMREIDNEANEYVDQDAAMINLATRARVIGQLQMRPYMYRVLHGVPLTGLQFLTDDDDLDNPQVPCPCSTTDARQKVPRQNAFFIGVANACCWCCWSVNHYTESCATPGRMLQFRILAGFILPYLFCLLHQ